MHGRATQGVFITSGSFTSGAHNYAQNLGGGLSLVLIDGERMARLMVKYRVGVQDSTHLYSHETRRRLFREYLERYLLG